MSVFRNFEVCPPEQIQVWSMSENLDDVTLFVPDDEKSQICYVPLRYSYSFTPGRRERNKDIPGQLYVQLNNDGNYTDGALLYQVGESLPIPLPKEYLNQAIPLNVGPGMPVQILVRQEFVGKYELQK